MDKYYTEEDVSQECILIQLERGDLILDQHLLRLEALNRLDPRRQDKTKGRREDRYVSYDYREDRRLTKEDMLLSFILRLYKIKDNKLYIKILEYLFLEGLSYIEISNKVHKQRQTVSRILDKIVYILS